MLNPATITPPTPTRLIILPSTCGLFAARDGQASVSGDEERFPREGHSLCTSAATSSLAGGKGWEGEWHSFRGFFGCTDLSSCGRYYCPRGIRQPRRRFLPPRERRFILATGARPASFPGQGSSAGATKSSSEAAAATGGKFVGANESKVGQPRNSGCVACATRARPPAGLEQRPENASPLSSSITGGWWRRREVSVRRWPRAGGPIPVAPGVCCLRPRQPLPAPEGCHRRWRGHGRT